MVSSVLDTYDEIKVRPVIDEEDDLDRYINKIMFKTSAIYDKWKMDLRPDFNK